MNSQLISISGYTQISMDDITHYSGMRSGYNFINLTGCNIWTIGHGISDCHSQVATHMKAIPRYVLVFLYISPLLVSAYIRNSERFGQCKSLRMAKLWKVYRR